MKRTMPKPAAGLPEVVRAALRRLPMDAADLLDWSVRADGAVILVAPNGMKFVLRARR